MKKKLSIVLGADHRGYKLKEYIKKVFLSESYSIEWYDVGAYNDVQSDYPEFAYAAICELQKEVAVYAILLCGTGVGMAITANRFPKIFAGVAWSEEVARLCKEDDNVDVLVVPADYVNEDDTMRIISAWLHAEFKHDRYEKRIAMINALDISKK